MFPFTSIERRSRQAEKARRQSRPPAGSTDGRLDRHGRSRPLAACNPADAHPDRDDFRRACRSTWARFMQPGYELNPWICPNGGGKCELIAFIHAPETMRKPHIF